MRYGLIPVEPTKEDYKQNGRIRLAGLVLQADGQWDTYLPPEELQDRGLATAACASFGTLACVEALIRQEFKDTPEYSDRFLAEQSGTTIYGNNPQTVCETLRKKGVCLEQDWPYSPDIKTWGEFYQTPPENIQQLAKTFTYEFDFAHQWIGKDPQSMMTALMYSPLGADVSAWGIPDADGIYHRFGTSNHWICIYGFEANKYWKCFDSYDNTHKKLAWDFGFTMVKGYTLHKQVAVESFWSLFLKQLRTLLGLDTPTSTPNTPVKPESSPTEPVKTLLWDTPRNSYHSVRVLCDEEGLTLDEKNLICACIYQESGFDNSSVCVNKDKAGKPWSKDVGIVQVNDYFHCGEGKQFPSADYVVANPEKAVRWMIDMYKVGQLKMWVSYSSGAYKRWLLKSSPMWTLA